MQLRTATIKDVNCILDMQIEAFREAAVKYGDYEGNPVCESIQHIKEKSRTKSNTYYLIVYDSTIVGGICIKRRGHDKYVIDPPYILSRYQNRGIAQHVLWEIEKVHPEAK